MPGVREKVSRAMPSENPAGGPGILTCAVEVLLGVDLNSRTSRQVRIQ